MTKNADINDQGTAQMIVKTRIKNQSEEPQTLAPLKISERTSDVVDIVVRHGKDSLPYVKLVGERGFVTISVDLKGITLEANETYDLDLRYTVPSRVKRFDHIYFCKDLFTIHEDSSIETYEEIVTYTLPELFSRKEFWKEMTVTAPQASEIYTHWGQKVIKYQFVLKRGSYREISFMFQERYNSKILALITFSLGVGFIQLFDWLVSLIS